jgi:hypothetical protein
VTSFLYGLKHMEVRHLLVAAAVLGLHNTIVWWLVATLLVGFLVVELAHGAVMAWTHSVFLRVPQALETNPEKGAVE